MVDQARTLPMSASAVVHRGELLGLLDRVRRRLPTALTRAEAGLGDRQEVLAQARSEVEALRAEAEVVHADDLWRRPDDLRAALDRADALIVRNQTSVDRELLGAAPGLRVVGRLGVGLDNIDLAAARERGLPVVFARAANAVSVAE